LIEFVVNVTSELSNIIFDDSVGFSSIIGGGGGVLYKNPSEN
jgi:hypothetical protein